ncbi:demethoxyubiquinone hydroxylase family protein [Blautia liquoris]|uniref:Demethoxyubiquinone hydroxylase family protein n=1 Tax=Blautia liquoris TaxID=2779518 RepID=A0A7M2RFU2_9FIRM|nr:demethoxyubiquinone hydroxylase family protein [Blautia liquoris]QOV19008.1 demethoxyubiquinone hydroxylase family protein [Blautia liquoris]
MPAFANPFQGNVDRKMNKDELIQAVRLDIAGELEAIYLYDAHVQATDNEMAKAVLADIRDEERAHVGELMTLLRNLDPKEADLFASGEGEVKEMLEDLGIADVGPSPVPGESEPSAPEGTVGSMVDED